MNLMFRATPRDEKPPLEALAGTAERITLHNPKNGFCVLKVQVRGKRTSD